MDIKSVYDIAGRAMAAQLVRLNTVASNLANAATPNYKARDISFEDEIKKFDKNGPIVTTHSNHIVQNSGKSIHETSYREPLITSLDGNTVELAVEQMQFAENSMRYTTTVNFPVSYTHLTLPTKA